MPQGFESFKNKMRTDENARAAFVLDVHNALQKQGVDIQDAKVMKDLGFAHGKLKDIGNVASSAIITLVM